MFLMSLIKKDVHSQGEGGVRVKAYVYCFYDVILLFKSVQGEGVKIHQILAYVLFGQVFLKKYLKNRIPKSPVKFYPRVNSDTRTNRLYYKN